MLESINRVVGRDRELSAIEELLTAATTGPAAVVLDGEAGIGKTTLWRAGLEAARARRFRILAASPSEAETGLAFAILADLLEPPALTELLPQLPAPQREAIEIALLLREAPEPAPEPALIAAGFLSAVRTLAARGPLLLAVDDVQWLDPPSAGVLRFALRRLDPEPVGILLARRSTSAPPPPFELDRASFAELVSSVRVGPLSLGALHHLLRERLGQTLPRPLLIRVHEAAAGNPFFALEIARELGESGAAPAPGEPLPVPDTLRVLTAERTSRLPSGLREVLLAVAALADPTVGTLEAALGTEAVERLHEAAELDLLSIQGERIRFTHPLLASGVYERAAPGQRRRTHRLLAEAVGTQEERARHLALGADGPDERVAVALDDAAARSAARGAPQIAAELSEWARRLTPSQSQADLVRRSVAAGHHHLAAGDTARAREVFESAFEDAADPAWRARARHGLARVAFRDTGWAEFARLLEQTLEDAAEPGLRCEIELDLAGALMQSDELRRALPHAERATEIARDLDRPDLLAAALSQQAGGAAMVGEGARWDLVDEGLAAAAEAERRGSRSGAGDVPAELGLAVVLKWADEFSEARRILEGLRLTLERSHAHASLPPTLYQLAELECWAGEWQRAGDLAAQCLDFAEQTGGTTLEPVALHPRTLLHALRGEVDAAREGGRAGLERCEQIANLRHRIRFHAVLGFTELSAGDAAAARDHLARADELASSAGYGEPAVFRFQQDHVEACLALGEVESAEALVERLEVHARAIDGPWCSALGARGRGLVRATQGDLDAAVEHLERALGAHDRLDQPFERARTMLALGTVQRRARRRGLAREALEQASAVFDELGATLWARRAREEIRRLGGRRPAGAELTPAQARIAELVAEGLSNKQVAARLFLTPKTVETQLTRIYAKLGVHSRTELAGRLARRPEASEPQAPREASEM